MRWPILLSLSALALSPLPAAGQTAQSDPTAAYSVVSGRDAVAEPEGAMANAEKVALMRVAEGLSDPVRVVAAPGEQDRLYVVERPGTVRIVESGKVLEEPFLDIREITVSSFLEQGLYDIAFHPDYAENGVFFVHFAEKMRNGDSIIARYRRSEDDPDKADPESSRLMMQIDQPWANHNGGEIAFGPDGHLWIGSGDGGWEGDPLGAGQDLRTRLGKILRIDVEPALSDEDGAPAYAIPEDNPFASKAGIVRLFGISEAEFARLHVGTPPEIWAYGIRSPWSFSFDPETGDLWMPDVGQNEYEEINYVPAGKGAGANFGWDHMMGAECFPISQDDCPTVGVLPVAQYAHDRGCSVIDVGVVRDEALPSMDGVYLASDFCSGTIWGISRGDGADSWEMATVLEAGQRVTGAGRGPDGALYVTACECAYGEADATGNGSLWKLVPANDVIEDDIAEGSAITGVATGG